MKRIVAILSIAVLVFSFCSAYAATKKEKIYIDGVKDFTMLFDTCFGMTMSEVNDQYYKFYKGQSLYSGSSSNGDPVLYRKGMNIAGVAGSTVYFFFNAQTKKLYQVTYEFPYSSYWPVCNALVEKYGSAKGTVYKNPKTEGTDFEIHIDADVLFKAVSRFNVVYKIDGAYREEITTAKVNINGL